MRISDWSSDVCSSDLIAHAGRLIGGRVRHKPAVMRDALHSQERLGNHPVPEALHAVEERARLRRMPARAVAEIGSASCRERVCPYVYISVVGVTLKKNITHKHT